MSATEPAAPPGGDPSMEDILASIRRILSEEEQPADPKAGDDAAPAPEDDVLVLESSMMVADPVVPTQEEPLVVAVPEPAKPATADAAGLVGPETARAAAASVAGLVAHLASERGTQVYRSGPTIEDLMRAELRPLLKEWLDTHLPPMVERLVRVEIERVVGRALP